jgi:hypothetical protein
MTRRGRRWRGRREAAASESQLARGEGRGNGEEDFFYLLFSSCTVFFSLDFLRTEKPSFLAFGVAGFGAVWLEVGSSEHWRARPASARFATQRLSALAGSLALTTSLWPVEFVA